MKIGKDGKTANITIRVTEELKQRAEDIWKKASSTLPFNTFLGEMVDLGLKEKKKWLDIKEAQDKALRDDVIMRTVRAGQEHHKKLGIPPDSPITTMGEAEIKKIVDDSVLQMAKTLGLIDTKNQAVDEKGVEDGKSA